MQENIFLILKVYIPLASYKHISAGDTKNGYSTNWSIIDHTIILGLITCAY